MMDLTDYAKTVAEIMRILVDGGFLDEVCDQLWHDADIVDGQPNESANQAALMSMAKYYLKSLEVAILIQELNGE